MALKTIENLNNFKTKNSVDSILMSISVNVEENRPYSVNKK